MVNHEASETSLDKLILQVFEEQEEKFSFPLTTMKQTRDFVRLLNHQGFTYEMLCDEIGEKFESFRSWRLGGGPDAIGKRVMTRLNKPLQEEMMDDDGETEEERNLCSGLVEESKSSGVKLEQTEESVMIVKTDTGQESKKETRIGKLKDDKRKDVSDEAICSIELENVKTLKEAKVAKDEKISERNLMSNTKGLEKKEQAKESNTSQKENNQAEEKRKELENMKNGDGKEVSSRTIHPEDRQAGIVKAEFQEIPTKQTTVTNEKLDSKASDHIMLQSSNTTNDSSKQSKTTSSLETAKKNSDMSTNKKSGNQNILKLGLNMAEEKISDNNITGNKVQEKQKELKSKEMKEKKETPSLITTHDISSNLFLESTSDILPTSPVNSSKQAKHLLPHTAAEMSQQPKPVYSSLIDVVQLESRKDLPALDKHQTKTTNNDYIEQSKGTLKQTQLDTTDETNDQTTKEEKQTKEKTDNLHQKPKIKPDSDHAAAAVYSNQMQSKVFNRNQCVTSDCSGVSKQHLTASEDVTESSSSSSLSPTSPLTTSTSLPTSQLTPKPPLLPTSSPSSSAKSTAGTNQNVAENYDSDLDFETESHSAEERALIEKLYLLKESEKNDSAGFLFIFSDTPAATGTGKHRIRIGVSRFPEKRFQQALLFNPDIRMVTSLAVEKRKTALQKAQDQLKSMSLRGKTGWYWGSLEVIMNIITELFGKEITQSTNDQQ